MEVHLFLCFRDVSGVETALSIHQGVKAEIDARSELHEECIALAEKLIADGHYASEDIKTKSTELRGKRNLIVDRWQERWDWLNLCKNEVYYDLEIVEEREA